MKLQELILDILGVCLFIVSIYGFYFLEVGFMESTAMGVAGLALLVLKSSSIRKFIEEIIRKKIGK